MRVLIVKTSSLGDVIHTLPALTDAGNNFSDISFDWVVESAFSEIPTFHPLVKKVIPVSLRRWRKNILTAIQTQEWQNFYSQLREEKYDFVIDAQGLIKSGFLTFLSKGTKCGYDRHSAWEPLACLAYNKKFNVNPNLHAITRIRKLFSQSLNYQYSDDVPKYGLKLNSNPNLNLHLENNNYSVFLHGTTRDDKCWPEEHWIKLITLFKEKNIKILLPWGNEVEKNRAEKLAQNQHHVEILPKSSLSTLANLLSHSKINIAVDTGLGHLSAALDAPTISLYGPTDPALIGTVGKNQIHIKENSLSEIMPEAVFGMTTSLL
jgi:heptosyltransferase-1